MALAAAGYTVTAASRTPSPKFPAPIITAVVDYSSVDTLAALFRGQDAVVEAFPPNIVHIQATVVDACLKAGTVKHIITPDFAGDTFSKHITELALYVPKVEAQKVLEEKIKGTNLSWSAIITGAWYDWGE
jgi:saccharopine dehydrogenase-like NADP-dependent oxidoreductase